jgi:hypothetical protein
MGEAAWRSSGIVSDGIIGVEVIDSACRMRKAT